MKNFWPGPLTLVMNYNLSYSIHKIDKEPILAGESINKNNVEKWKHYDVICMP